MISVSSCVAAVSALGLEFLFGASFAAMDVSALAIACSFFVCGAHADHGKYHYAEESHRKCESHFRHGVAVMRFAHWASQTLFRVGMQSLDGKYVMIFRRVHSRQLGRLTAVARSAGLSEHPDESTIRFSRLWRAISPRLSRLASRRRRNLSSCRAR